MKFENPIVTNNLYEEKYKCWMKKIEKILLAMKKI